MRLVGKSKYTFNPVKVFGKENDAFNIIDRKLRKMLLRCFNFSRLSGGGHASRPPSEMWTQDTGQRMPPSCDCKVHETMAAESNLLFKELYQLTKFT